jgi:hypothetical protein
MKWPEYTHFTTGSKAEGIAKYYGSDLDRLFIQNDVKCLEEGMTDSKSIVFNMDKFKCSPGYTRLILSKSNNHVTPEEISICLIEENGQKYISNNLTRSFVEISKFGKNALKVDLNGLCLKFVKYHGPCVSFKSDLTFDFVAGFECSSQHLLGKWEQRKRTYDWPDSILVKEISRSEGHVVPVANVNSQFTETEWRICFTKAELFLVNALEEHHIKVYILLKELSKKVIKPICPAITSYIVKNIILWQAENTPKELFAPRLLLFRLIDALKFLQDCIRSNSLRSYLIEDRNIFYGRISENQRMPVIDKIDKLLNDDEKIIQEVKTLFEAYDNFDTPAIIRKAKKEEQIEKLLMEQSLVFVNVYDRDHTQQQFLDCLTRDREFVELKNELFKLVIPDSYQIPLLASDSYLYRRQLYRILQ